MKLRVKGINDGLLITLPRGDWDDAVLSLKETIDEKPAFFNGASLYIDTGAREMSVTDLSGMRGGLEEYGIHLKGILSTSDKTIQNCSSLGLYCDAVATRKSFKEKPQPSAAKKADAGILFLEKNIRSGSSVKSANPIVIIGDVHPGAEVTSEKSVTVWGVVRGSVTAGLPGGEVAVIRALGFEDARLTIQDVSRFVKADKKNKGVRSPLTASVKENEIVLENR